MLESDLDPGLYNVVRLSHNCQLYSLLMLVWDVFSIYLTGLCSRQSPVLSPDYLYFIYALNLSPPRILSSCIIFILRREESGVEKTWLWQVPFMFKLKNWLKNLEKDKMPPNFENYNLLQSSIWSLFSVFHFYCKWELCVCPACDERLVVVTVTQCHRSRQ